MCIIESLLHDEVLRVHAEAIGPEFRVCSTAVGLNGVETLREVTSDGDIVYTTEDASENHLAAHFRIREADARQECIVEI
jgi:hypothetical protein